MRLIGRSLLAAAVLASLPACGSVANPRSCIDGTCTSDEFPFCDVDGAFGADPNTCIAVTCEPGVFAQCRDDVAVTCNASGTDYDLVSCPLGCQDGVGCRACQPNETVCANGAVQTCDATGNVTSSEACALGCFESEPRCRDIAPSNGLAQYADAVPSPPDLDLSSGAGIDVETGTVTVAGQPLIVPTVLVNRPLGGVPIRVLVVNNIVIGDVGVYSNRATTLNNQPALAIVATGDITIAGPLRLNGNGSLSNTACDGKAGFTSSASPYLMTGSGGGGHATAGAPGGAITNSVHMAPDGGLANGSTTLVPLRGGCASGAYTPGGGAVQLSARGRIIIDGLIDAMGGGGQAEQGSVSGGGAGGGVLLEGASVEIGAHGKLLATGGAGASSQRNGDYSETADAPLGGTCAVGATYCGVGGNGASSTGPATPGASVPYSGSVTYIGSGGGGGGLGRVRINTPTSTYSTTSSSVIVGDISTGVLATR